MKIYIVVGCLIVVAVFVISYNNVGFTERGADIESEKKDFCTKRYIFAVLPDGVNKGAVSEGIVDTIGCNDQLVRVEIDTCDASIEDVIKRTFDYEDEKGIYYNSLGLSEIVIDQIVHEDGNADIFLKGELLIGGMCDAPRVMNQLQEGVLQFDNVDTVNFYINGEKLSDFLSEKD